MESERRTNTQSGAPENARQDRLKRALRDNLKRRKSQSRQRERAAAAAPDDQRLLDLQEGPPPDRHKLIK